MGAVVVGSSAGRNLPSGWNMTVNSGADCGTQFGGQGQPTTNTGVVGFKVTVDDDPASASGVAIPSCSGYQFAPSTQDPGSLVQACLAAANANQ